MYDWDDLRCFLAAARTGSTLTAARALRLSQPTVARRLAALEKALGLQLFHRRPAGYRLTEHGEALLAEAERVEAAAVGLETAAQAIQRDLSGVVRLTTNEFIAAQVLAPGLRKFRALYPEIKVEVTATERFLDIAAGEADIAVRSGRGPDSAGLVKRRVSYSDWQVFCSRAYADQHGKPETEDDLDKCLIVSAEGVLTGMPAMRWLEARAPKAQIVLRSNSLVNLIAAVRAGVGVAILPREVLLQDPDLVPCLAPIRELRAEVWLVTHERLRNVPRVRALLDFIAAFAGATQAQVRPAREPPPS